MERKGTLYIVTGPSGVGKGTVLSILRARDDKLFFSVSATTRDPRPGEQDGVQYYFLSREEFDKRVEQNAFLEYACYARNCYGTLEAPVNERLAAGYDVILEIEVQGAAQVRAKRADAVSIFLAPPSFEALEARLRGRGTESEQVIAGRLAIAKHELTCAGDFDHVVINDEVEHAVDELQQIFAQRRALAE